MEYTFEIKLFEGHLLFNYADHFVLVDTGSLYSVSDNGFFEFLGVKYTVKDSFMDICVGYLANLMGLDFDIVMGMDVFSKYNVHIDYSSMRITFSDVKLQIESASEISLFSNPGEVICIPVKIDGLTVRSIIDTEAEVSYLNKSFIIGNGENSAKTCPDEHRAYMFHTNRYKKRTELADIAFDINYGTFPDVMELQLNCTNVEAIIGYDLFNAFEVVFNWTDRIMLAKKFNT